MSYGAAVRMTEGCTSPPLLKLRWCLINEQFLWPQLPLLVPVHYGTNTAVMRAMTFRASPDRSSCHCQTRTSWDRRILLPRDLSTNAFTAREEQLLTSYNRCLEMSWQCSWARLPRPATKMRLLPRPFDPRRSLDGVLYLLEEHSLYYCSTCAQVVAEPTPWVVR